MSPPWREASGYIERDRSTQGKFAKEWSPDPRLERTRSTHSAKNHRYDRADSKDSTSTRTRERHRVASETRKGRKARRRSRLPAEPYPTG